MLDTVTERRAENDSDEIHLDAYNAAFYELGLKWHWTSDTYRDLQQHACERERLRTYLETRQPHLLRAYDSEFLVNAIHTVKTRRHQEMTEAGRRSAGRVDWAEMQRLEVGA